MDVVYRCPNVLRSLCPLSTTHDHPNSQDWSNYLLGNYRYDLGRDHDCMFHQYFKPAP